MSGDGAWVPPGGDPAREWASVEGWAERAGQAEPPTEPPPWQATGPGVVPLRPLAVGELLDGAVKTMRRHVRATLGIAAVVVVVEQLVRLAFAAAAGDLAGGNGSPFIAGSSFGAAGLAAFVVDAVLSAVLTGLITAVVLDDAAGRPVSVRTAWERVRPLTWRLVGASVLAALLPFLGLVGLILFGVFLWAALALAPAVVVAEDTRVWQSLRRSWRLVVPSWWRVFGVLLLGVLIAGVVGGIVDVPVFAVIGAVGASGTDTLGPGAYAVVVVFSTLGAIVTRPFVAALTALLYLDRRMRGEGLDLELPAAAAPAPWTQA